MKTIRVGINGFGRIGRAFLKVGRGRTGKKKKGGKEIGGFWRKMCIVLYNIK